MWSKLENVCKTLNKTFIESWKRVENKRNHHQQQMSKQKDDENNAVDIDYSKYYIQHV